MENKGLVKVMGKVGFETEGIQKEYYKLDKMLDDKVLFGMTKSQFENKYLE